VGKKVLVTGGAGFVGTHLVDALLQRGDKVRVFDNLDPQVHGPERKKPAWLAPEAELVVGDVRDPEAIEKSLDGCDQVFHLAAAVGVAQSMYQIASYTATNTLGTANLLQALLDTRKELDRLVVASSMSIYGEGRYVRPDGLAPSQGRRSLEQLYQHEWELRDIDGTVLSPVPTDETKVLDPTSIYALNKVDQERMVLQFGDAYGMSTVALRFFNIYGPRQALSNPYTGVAAIFSSRLMNGNQPLIFEDGEQSRDFVSVHDVVRGILAAAEREEASGRAINVGSGRAVTVREVADTLVRVMCSDVEPQVTGRYRVGDIRHCFADIRLARSVLGYQPEITLAEGMEELVAWLREQDRPVDGITNHAAELAARGLTR
jgi:dTDP-L-rhamnose 4-epimerase